MKIAIGNDHAGVDLKHKIVEFLRKKGHEVTNVGTDTLDSVDYPDIAKEVAEKVLSGEAKYGVLICGTGIGISISANKVKGIRAALVHNEFTARLSRLHNDANVIALGARVLGDELAAMCVDTFINTEFEGGRHARRVGKIEEEK
ncbi:ribose 5-phosphate isomerase B [Pseudoleptotrichia goodfellowii]|uniref:Ribose-5-phosphate isomerase B n=2 Tax=Pseudoleptotrichia goodfellowii TaxID=157692 RepID=D0GIU4_9FUSO|nr:ribose 5-phosphate isomerase B [Pseudoleptotrichia goodfellowii]EEY36006.1 ribose-5-phosphate isomerase B [Pseudoleptotrichia goodfellowii F0264]BBM36190.1 RpiB/LacA/LacB family sugar-phosphate isomerase [Pseudoleptotrichia goodfellowii]